MGISRIATFRSGDIAALVTVDGKECVISRNDMASYNTPETAQTEIDRLADQTLNDLKITVDGDGEYDIALGNNLRGS